MSVGRDDPLELPVARYQLRPTPADGEGAAAEPGDYVASHSHPSWLNLQAAQEQLQVAREVLATARGAASRAETSGLGVYARALDRFARALGRFEEALADRLKALAEQREQSGVSPTSRSSNVFRRQPTYL
jgi:hypothetical protein